MRRQSAYYARAESFSRSYNAHVAEDEGRLPRTRAAAALGVSVPAFDAGCRAARYVSTEWHHVGKYATRVYYYDCDELRRTPAFWQGAADHYKSAVKRAALMEAAAQAKAAAQQEDEADRLQRIESFRALLIARRDCSRPVKRHDPRHAWLMRCQKVGAQVDYLDVAGMAAATEAWKKREAAALVARARLMSIICQHFRQHPFGDYVGVGLRIKIHGGMHPHKHVVNIYGLSDSMNLSIAAAVAMLEDFLCQREANARN